MRRTTPLVASALALVACAAPPPVVERRAFALEVSAANDHGKPVAAAEIWLNGALIGSTDRDGRLLHRFVSSVGSALRVDARCPERFHAEGTSKQLRARADSTAASAGPAALPVALQCTPTHRQAMIVVRSDGRSLPILLDGQPVGRTSKSGIAHLLLEVAEGQSFELSLDTTGSPRLEPQQPLIAFHVADDDQRFVFDQAFHEAPLAKKRHRRPKPPPVEERPTRIETHKRPWKPVAH